MESAIEIPSRVEPWAFANEYPASSLPGEADALFAHRVAQRTRGRVSVLAAPDEARALYAAARSAYDETGARLGARSSVVSFADLPAKIAAGEIDAVLSSGDGGAGQALREHLPRFTAIEYAMPLSFATLNLDKWSAFDAVTRGEVEAAARQWQALPGRVAENHARMREHGMSLVTQVSPVLRQGLREAARHAIEDWRKRAGAGGAALLERAGMRR